MSVARSQERQLRSIPAREVQAGDQVDFRGERMTVNHNVAGQNRQVHLVLENMAGAIIVPEHDPSEIVSVWR